MSGLERSGYVDLGLTGVEQTADGWTVDLHNTGGLAIPFAVVATYADGTTAVVPGGTATWKEADTTTVILTGDKEPMKVQVASGPFLDVTPTDGIWISPNAPVPTASPAASVTSPTASPAG